METMAGLRRFAPISGALIIVLFAFIAFALLAPAGASATTLSWSSASEIDPQGGGQDLMSVVCPTASQCTTVDSAGEEITFNPANPGVPAPVTLDSGGALRSVVCPTASQCTAVSYWGDEVTFDPASPGTPTLVTIDNQGGIESVSCPSVSQCTAVDSNGRELTFDPANPATPTAITIDTNNKYLESVACPSVSQCTAVDGGGDEVTFDPTDPGTPAAVTIDADVQYLTSIACSSVSQCTAVGEDGNGGDEVTFDPTDPGTPTPVTVTGASLGSIACPTASQCTVVEGGAAGAGGGEVTFNPTSPGTPALVTVDDAGSTSGVACPTATQCTAVDGDNWNSRGIPESYTDHEVTFNPVSPGTPTPVAIDSGGILMSLSCPSASQCTAVDSADEEFTFSPNDPAARTSTSIDDNESVEATTDYNDTYNGVPSIACPTVSQCTAVDSIGNEVTFNPMSPGTPTPVALDANDSLDSVACLSANRCVAVGYDEITFNPTNPGKPTPVAINVNSSLVAVACPTVDQCTAITSQDGQEVTFDPGNVGTPTPVTIDHSGHNLVAIACPITTQCTAVGQYGEEVTFNPTNPGTPTPATQDDSNYLASIDCPSTTDCVAVDDDGNAVEGDPTSSAAWAIEPITGTTYIDAVACPHAGECVVADGTGHVALGTYAALPVPPVSTSKPTITFAGELQPGAVLSEVHGTWNGSPMSYGYQWYDCDSSGGNCLAIGGATGQTYALVAGDVGHTVVVAETARNSAGAGSPARSSATGVVSAVGGVVSPTPGQIKADLTNALKAVTGTSARIANILKASGYKATITSPGAGKVTISWYAKIKNKRTLIATGAVTTGKAGKTTLKIVLNKTGKQLLKTAKSLKLAQTASYTPAHGKSTTLGNTITLKR